MTDDINLIEMFEGLSVEQAKQLRESIARAVKTEYQKFTQGETTMTDELEFDQMTDEEKQEMARDVEASRRRIAAQRQENKLQPLIEAYRREIKGAQGQRHLAEGIRNKYRAMGVPVDNIHFTV